MHIDHWTSLKEKYRKLLWTASVSGMQRWRGKPESGNAAPICSCLHEDEAAIGLCLVSLLLRGSFNCVDIPANNYVSSWLYNVGTLGFSHMAYLTLEQDFDVKDRARELLSSCINYARYYNSDMDVWKKYRESHVSVLLYMIKARVCLSKNTDDSPLIWQQ